MLLDIQNLTFFKLLAEKKKSCDIHVMGKMGKPFIYLLTNKKLKISHEKKCKQRDQNVILDFDKTQINTLDRQTAFFFPVALDLS